MNTLRKRRVWLVVILSSASLIVTLLVIQALRHNLNLYYTPTELQTADISNTQKIRIGGLVEKGSLQRGSDLIIQFVVTDLTHQISVQYTGILPDLFKEGQGVVASGRLNGKALFVADEILAKHDENYQPPRILDHGS